MNLLPPAPNPDRWLLAGALALLLGLGIYVSCLRPGRVVYADGSPVLVGKKDEQRLRAAFGRDTSSANTQQRQAARTERATAPILTKAQHLRHATHRVRPRRLPVAADSLARLADSLTRRLTAY